MRYALWNPYKSYQYACFHQHKLELIDIVVDASENRQKEIIGSVSIPTLSCFDWQHKKDSNIIAYGTASGNVFLIDWEKRCEVFCYYCILTLTFMILVICRLISPVHIP
jgi:hypothetical protein